MEDILQFNYTDQILPSLTRSTPKMYFSMCFISCFIKCSDNSINAGISTKAKVVCHSVQAINHIAFASLPVAQCLKLLMHGLRETKNYLILKYSNGSKKAVAWNFPRQTHGHLNKEKCLLGWLADKTTFLIFFFTRWLLTADIVQLQESKASTPSQKQWQTYLLTTSQCRTTYKMQKTECVKSQSWWTAVQTLPSGWLMRNVEQREAYPIMQFITCK